MYDFITVATFYDKVLSWVYVVLYDVKDCIFNIYNICDI